MKSRKRTWSSNWLATEEQWNRLGRSVVDPANPVVAKEGRLFYNEHQTAGMTLDHYEYYPSRLLVEHAN